MKFKFRELTKFSEFTPFFENDGIDFGKDQEKFIISSARYCNLLKVEKLNWEKNWKQYGIYIVDKKNYRLIGIYGLYDHPLKKNEIVKWLGWFGIIKEHQNKGIGSQVLNKILVDLKKENVNKLYLFTDTSDKFYIKNNFKYLGTTEELVLRGFCHSDISYHLDDKIFCKEI